MGNNSQRLEASKFIKLPLGPARLLVRFAAADRRYRVGSPSKTAAGPPRAPTHHLSAPDLLACTQ